MKIPDAPVVDLEIDGIERSFDLDDPVLPDWVKEEAFESGDYPYSERLNRKKYNKRLEALQEELVKLMYCVQGKDKRIVIVFEGRDSAGKGGTIERFRENLNSRVLRTVALTKPSDREQGQWYFQRYVEHFPTSGEIVLFDRSWYNRAGVEPVMGFCTPQEHETFLDEVPHFENMIRREGIHFFKFWLNIGQEMQLKRFHDRRHNPLKVWKLSPIDIKALGKWDEYTQARDLMFARTHRPQTPWTVIRANDKRRARLEAIRTVLIGIDYDGKDVSRIGQIDENIVRDPQEFSD